MALLERVGVLFWMRSGRGPVSAAVAALLVAVGPGLTAAARADDRGSSVRRVVRPVSVGADEQAGSRVLNRRFFRPLRTFRGRPVRTGPGNRSELSIGVVRAIRADGSKSIGVVRPIRGVAGDGSPTPRVQPGGLVQTGGVAVPAASAPAAAPARALVPGVASGGLGVASLQIYAGRLRPVVEGADPWDLLNAGRYRAAAERFDAAGNDAQRTGAALAAALSGDLVAAAKTMPVEPVLPAGASLDAATRLRLGQVREVFFADNAAMRNALSVLRSAGE